MDRPGLAWPIEESLKELERLADTDEADVVAVFTQRLAKPIPKTYIGSGKASEIAQCAEELDADVVIFDEELSPSQQSNLEHILGGNIKVIDRTALILDIFARHARTREGRLQVQLAQNKYLLPRLRGMWSHLVREQTRGGIGSRFGQGESQLEVDRRLVRKRISSLERELEVLERRRNVQSHARHSAGIYRVSLVGYTNAGKSTTLNALSDASVYVKDELFATLDPTTRSIELDEGRRITLTDTVGFIQKLPTSLIEAFKSTLLETRKANLLLKVVDAHDPHAQMQLQTVDRIIDDLGAHNIPSVVVYNKCDLLKRGELDALCAQHSEAEFISAATGFGMRSLCYRIAKEASREERLFTVCIPFSEGSLVRTIHERCHVVHEAYNELGCVATIRADERMAQALKKYTVETETQIMDN